MFGKDLKHMPRSLRWRQARQFVQLIAPPRVKRDDALVDSKAVSHGVIALAILSVDVGPRRQDKDGSMEVKVTCQSREFRRRHRCSFVKHSKSLQGTSIEEGPGLALGRLVVLGHVAPKDLAGEDNGFRPGRQACGQAFANDCPGGFVNDSVAK